MEDCCKSDKDEQDRNKEGKMVDLKKVIIWTIIAILIIAVVYVLFFRGSLGGSAVSSSGQAARSASAMVGGC